jgi:hypothetical protein
MIVINNFGIRSINRHSGDREAAAQANPESMVE